MNIVTMEYENVPSLNTERLAKATERGLDAFYAEPAGGNREGKFAKSVAVAIQAYLELTADDWAYHDHDCIRFHQCNCQVSAELIAEGQMTGPQVSREAKAWFGRFCSPSLGEPYWTHAKEILAAL